MVKKCILPVAGFGSRFLPVTKTIPKEMLPILNKPLIQYAVEEVLDSDINDIAFITSKLKTSIEEYFKKNDELECLINGTEKEILLSSLNKIIKNCNLNFINQDQMLGLGHAIMQGKDFVGENSFAVLLPDDLCYNKDKSVLKQLLEISKKYPDMSIVAIEEVDSSSVNQYGIIDGELLGNSSNIYLVNDMIEKPDIKHSPSNMAIIGRYILQPQVFEILRNTRPDLRGEIQITDALKKLSKESKVLAVKFEGIRLDCGSVKGYIEANNYFNN